MALPLAWLTLVAFLALCASIASGASVSDAVRNASVDLLDAGHMLHFLDVVDAFGHVSVRNPDNASQFIMSFTLAPALATSQSLVTYDNENATSLFMPFNDTITGANIPAGFSERFIHSEIYKAFPDVISVVHAHSTAVLPFGIAQVPLRAEMHTSGSLGSDGTPIFDTRTLGPDILPPTALQDTLVRTPALGHALANTFCNSSAMVLMRFHGMAVRGPTIRDAVVRSFYAVEAAKAQLAATQLGGVGSTASLDAAQALDAQTTIDGLADRAWALWQTQVDNADIYINDLRASVLPPDSD